MSANASFESAMPATLLPRVAEHLCIDLRKELVDVRDPRQIPEIIGGLATVGGPAETQFNAYVLGCTKVYNPSPRQTDMACDLGRLTYGLLMIQGDADRRFVIEGLASGLLDDGTPEREREIAEMERAILARPILPQLSTQIASAGTPSTSRGQTFLEQYNPHLRHLVEEWPDYYSDWFGGDRTIISGPTYIAYSLLHASAEGAARAEANAPKG